MPDLHDHHREDGDNRHVSPDRVSLANCATLHCLAGCGVGEVVGVVIGVSLGLSRLGTMALAVSLGFVFGLALGLLPLLRAGFLDPAGVQTGARR